MSTMTSTKHKCLLVTHDAVNFSPSKAKYSFSKDQRFKSISGTVRTPSEFTHHLPQTFGRRSPSFGVGERFKNGNRQCKYTDRDVFQLDAIPSVTICKRFQAFCGIELSKLL